MSTMASEIVDSGLSCSEIVSFVTTLCQSQCMDSRVAEMPGSGPSSLLHWCSPEADSAAHLGVISPACNVAEGRNSIAPLGGRGQAEVSDLSVLPTPT